MCRNRESKVHINDLETKVKYKSNIFKDNWEELPAKWYDKDYLDI